MRKTFAIIAVAVTAVVATPQLAGAAPDRDRVTGSGTATNGIESKVNAQSGPQGENPRGTLHVGFDDDIWPGVPDRKVKISCLVVIGNTAMIGGLDQTGTETFVAVEDNGDTGDRTSFSTGLQGGPGPDDARCALVLSSSALFAPNSGNFTVEDS